MVVIIVIGGIINVVGDDVVVIVVVVVGGVISVVVVVGNAVGFLTSLELVSLFEFKIDPMHISGRATAEGDLGELVKLELELELEMIMHRLHWIGSVSEKDSL